MARRVEGQGNPHYGTGCYRRMIRMRRLDDATVSGELFDDFHAMTCVLRHDGAVVTAVEPVFVRIPTNFCLGADASARAIAEVRLDTPVGQFFGGGRPNINCSHMFDLVWLLMRHALRGGDARSYEIAFPDHVGPGPARISLLRDGAPALEWLVDEETIVSPEPFAGRQILSGFVRWARETLDAETLEAAMTLQKGFMVAGARRFSDRQLDGPLLLPLDANMRGTCWAYTDPRFDQIVRTDSRRDMTKRDAVEVFG